MNAAPVMQSAAVIGAGSWGTALATALAWRGMQVQFWGRDAALMSEIATTRKNPRYLPNLDLPANVEVVAHAADLKPVDMLVFVVPSKGIREAAQLIASSPAAKSRAAVSCAKGIEMHTGLRMSEILAGSLPQSTIAVLTGPNHAEEVASQLATAAVVACHDEETAKAVRSCFTLPFFRCYTTDDITGAAWAGAMKNPYAIAAGIALGLKLGDNAIAALVTRALAEMVRLGVAMGGRGTDVARESAALVPDAEGTTDPSAALDLGADAAAEFGRLPEPWRAALILRIDQGLAYDEIAVALDATVAQIKTWIFRARAALAAASTIRP